MRPSTRKYVVGVSGATEALAVSLLHDGRVLFAAEEDKLQRVKRIGLTQLKGRRSAALDSALHSAQATIGDVEVVVCVPSAAGCVAGDEEALLTRFLEEQYGESPPVVGVDHWAAHSAFARAVAPAPRPLSCSARNEPCA